AAERCRRDTVDRCETRNQRFVLLRQCLRLLAASTRIERDEQHAVASKAEIRVSQRRQMLDEQDRRAQQDRRDRDLSDHEPVAEASARGRRSPSAPPSRSVDADAVANAFNAGASPNATAVASATRAVK